MILVHKQIQTLVKLSFIHKGIPSKKWIEWTTSIENTIVNSIVPASTTMGVNTVEFLLIIYIEYLL